MKYKLYTLVVLFAVSLNGCGFKLRGTQVLPGNINSVVVQAEDHSLLARALVNRLPVYELNDIEQDQRDASEYLTISLQPEQLERRLLSVFSTGQVAEYELIYAVNYWVTFPNREPIQAQFEVLRDYQDDPDRALAKSRELTTVLDEMRVEAADRIIRLLSSQATQSATN